MQEFYIGPRGLGLSGTARGVAQPLERAGDPLSRRSRIASARWRPTRHRSARGSLPDSWTGLWRKTLRSKALDASDGPGWHGPEVEDRNTIRVVFDLLAEGLSQTNPLGVRQVADEYGVLERFSEPEGDFVNPSEPAIVPDVIREKVARAAGQSIELSKDDNGRPRRATPPKASSPGSPSNGGSWLGIRRPGDESYRTCDVRTRR